ncbi:MAG: electron transfer flavoprotein-ubiquinone oxidoreductase [Candidatus Tectomicrobia bacterium]|nr:electron transfer flavoprotein-ubiquinone oxidoreductase [Candidatus Tectomicrobia bacterium]
MPADAEEERESLDLDVLFVGAGPATLAGALHLSNLIARHNDSVGAGGRRLEAPAIAVIEKGAALGNHSLSGAVMNPVALRELMPDFLQRGAPLDHEVTEDAVYFLTERQALKLPITPPPMRNHGNYVVSLNRLVKWLGEQVEAAGADVFPGFAGVQVLYEGERVVGVRTGDKGIDAQGRRRSNFEPGIDLKAKVTVFGEGARGSLTKELVKRLALDSGSSPQLYATGVKEVWEVPAARTKPGRVLHTLGYPLQRETFGGGFLYTMAQNLVSVGFVVGLDYADPFLDPHAELQRFKLHPLVATLLRDGKMLHYGAKTIPEGGYYSIPRLTCAGGLLVGDSAGLVNVPRLKGIHYAMKSGMLAAETILDGLLADDFSAAALGRYETALRASYVGRDLYAMRHFRQAFEGGLWSGMLKSGLIFATAGRWPFKRRQPLEDHRHLRKLAGRAAGRQAPADGKGLRFDDQLTFAKLTDVYHSGTTHEENQPAHLLVPDRRLCSTKCREEYGNPCQFFCPAQVYEMEADEAGGGNHLKLNPSNCVHCKTCDIKDPYGNITWVPPEGGGGPVYTNL